MEKVIKLGDKEYKLHSSLFTIIDYRNVFGSELFSDIKKLEKFWSETTRIPLSQFYGARVDKRTLGRVSEKREYKGVCRIDYFSSAVDLELKRIAQQVMTSFSKKGP